MLNGKYNKGERHEDHKEKFYRNGPLVRGERETRKEDGKGNK